MFGTRRKTFWVLAVTLVLGLVAAGCGSSNKSSGGGSGGKIALLLPETKTARYETQDRPIFEKKVKELCSSCSILYSNADQDPAKQQSQAEAALTQGAKVLVVDAVDAASAASIVTKAKAQKVPVISYDRLIT
ncbi:MAG: D-xylose transport system substrate-binding protein, partial [Thermoleophilaceae bacterium]|nr:D-xylose transport system substrate-binding protein [Thermoleophilaceae bacterium]